MTEPGKEVARVGVYAQSSLGEKWNYASALAKAGDLVPKTFWTKPQPAPGGGMLRPEPNPGAILYMLETAAMIGVNPMVGLTNIHIIEGKPSLSANLQAALVREAGHRLRVWTEGNGADVVAICEIVRSDDTDFTFRVEWGKDESKNAGVDNKDNWKKYRRSMLKARAITECIREACPEVLMGATYSPDELGAKTDEMGEPIDLPQVPTADGPSQAGTAPKPQAPIVDPAPTQEAPEHPAEDAPVDAETGEVADAAPFDWYAAGEEAQTADEALALYRRAKAEGLLNLEIKKGRKPKRVLGPWLIEIGKALRALEEQAAIEADAAEAQAMVFAEAAAEQQSDDDDDVVHAEVVEDDQP